MAATPREQLPRKIIDPKLVAEAEALMAAERAACRGCQEEAAYERTTGSTRMHPSHFGAYVRDGVLWQRPCESGNRVFDPALHAFVGHAYCTCDACF